MTRLTSVLHFSRRLIFIGPTNHALSLTRSRWLLTAKRASQTPVATLTRPISGKQMYNWNTERCSGKTKVAKYSPIQRTAATSPNAERILGIYLDLKNK